MIKKNSLSIFKKHQRYFAFLVWLFSASAWCETPLYFSLDTTASKALISKNYQQALDLLWAQKDIPDSAFWNFKKAVAHFYTKDYKNAAACFLFSGKKDPQIAAFSNEFIGDIAGIQKNIREAVESYLRAQKDSLPSDHAHAIRDKITALVATAPMLMDTIPFLNAYYADTQKVAKDTIHPPDLYKSLDSLAFSTDKAFIDSVLALYTDSLITGDSCAVFSRTDALHLPDSLLSTKRLFRISQLALSCKSYEKAQFYYSIASTRPDFSGNVPARAALLLAGFLEYYSGRHTKALTHFLQYKNKYGPFPELLHLIARAYYHLNQDEQAMNIHELFLKLYPNDGKANLVLWRLAWENDQRGNFQKAIMLYTKLTEKKKNSGRAPDALFRVGLCNYKMHRYSGACSLFARCVNRYPDAACALASQYWKSQSLLSLNEKASAQKQFEAISRAAPTDYYAFRAREGLALLGTVDSSCIFDTTCKFLCAREWLDSITAPGSCAVSPQDSCFFDRAKKLVFSGCQSNARYYLEPLEMRYIDNLKFQLDIGTIYDLLNDPTSTFRVGRRILWRIPSKYRSSTPLPLYTISYPFAFLNIIKPTADSNTVDPFLVLGIIRQESVFNPSIVSRAGAVGLMQIMPATAKQVASELHEPFNIDSLSQATANIRWGVHYIKKLLDQFDGNIIQAIAGYNGGPLAIAKWFEQNKGKTLDLFIEDIGYEETRGYVKKVLANYWTYKILSRLTVLQ
jgi:TolA-binding protein